MIGVNFHALTPDKRIIRIGDMLMRVCCSTDTRMLASVHAKLESYADSQNRTCVNCDHNGMMG